MTDSTKGWFAFTYSPRVSYIHASCFSNSHSPASSFLASSGPQTFTFTRRRLLGWDRHLSWSLAYWLFPKQNHHTLGVHVVHEHMRWQG